MQDNMQPLQGTVEQRQFSKRMRMKKSERRDVKSEQCEPRFRQLSQQELLNKTNVQTWRTNTIQLLRKKTSKVPHLQTLRSWVKNQRIWAAAPWISAFQAVSWSHQSVCRPQPGILYHRHGNKNLGKLTNSKKHRQLHQEIGMLLVEIICCLRSTWPSLRVRGHLAIVVYNVTNARNIGVENQLCDRCPPPCTKLERSCAALVLHAWVPRICHSIHSIHVQKEKSYTNIYNIISSISYCRTFICSTATQHIVTL